MSSDNGIYILETKKLYQPDFGEQNEVEYRVAHAQSIEDVWYQHDPNMYFLWSYWYRSEIYEDKADALMQADYLASKEHILEYGISTILYSNIVFPSEKEAVEWAKENDRFSYDHYKQLF